MNAMIAWFARNSVAANLLMVFIILMGVNGIVNRLPVEVFPDFAPDEVEVRVYYRGATPEQMEESIVIPLENAIADLPGIEEIKSSASEGRCKIEVEVESGRDPSGVLDDVKSRVDAISGLPESIEPPIVRLEESLHEVVTLILHGDMSEYDLYKLGERVRDEVGRLDGVSRVVMRGLRNYEISIEISEQVLREHGLTLQAVANAVRESAVDIPGGTIRAANGELLVRTEGRAFDRAAFEKIIVKGSEDGSHLTLGEIANITDAFEENRVVMRFNGKRCAVVHVARTGDQNALKIEHTVKDYLAKLMPQLPEGVSIDIWNNRADIIKKRLVTLNDSAFVGIGCIIVLLGLFLRPGVAFWVCLGVPIAFMGAFAMMPYLGVTINLFTLYGFILVLGILVDDAIVTGERIHAFQQRGSTKLEGAIKGAQEVATPVIFGVLTTMIAFVPLLLVEGRRGQIFAQIPLVVIPCLIFSLVESKLILPAHLGHALKQRTLNHAKMLLLWGGVPGYLLGTWFTELFGHLAWKYSLEVPNFVATYGPLGLGVILTSTISIYTIRVLLRDFEEKALAATNGVLVILAFAGALYAGWKFSGIKGSPFILPWDWPYQMWIGGSLGILLASVIVPSIQKKFADSLEWGIAHIYRPILAVASLHRYATLAIFVGIALVICSYSFSGRLSMIYFPPIDSEIATSRLVMPQGTAYDVTERKMQIMIQSAEHLRSQPWRVSMEDYRKWLKEQRIAKPEDAIGENRETFVNYLVELARKWDPEKPSAAGLPGFLARGKDVSQVSLVGDVITTVGGQNIAGVRGSPSSGVANLAEVQMKIMAPEDRGVFALDQDGDGSVTGWEKKFSLRDFKTRELTRIWRAMFERKIQGAKEITTRSVIGRTRDPVAIKLSMPALDTSDKTTASLAEVSADIQSELETYTGLFDIHDTFERRKEEVRPTLKPEAAQRGLTRALLGRQVQGGFFGHEAQRIQRGQNQVRVMVRYPLAERESLASLESMNIRTPEGASVPLSAVADLEMTESYPSIRRTDLARTLYVVADADKYDSSVDLDKIHADLEPKVTEMVASKPGMSFKFVGESLERAESFDALKLGGVIIILGIYAMLAIPFKSYSQPLIVMGIIPFSIIGALLGHMIMGVSFSIMSAFGLLAMAGVVVNDSLVMVHYINLKRDEGLSLLEAVRNAGGARFRPILLTSLTTFGGILPTMFEKSTQAQFVIPMGISLAWGVLFATFITLILVPVSYLILEDIKSLARRYWNWQLGRKTATA